MFLIEQGLSQITLTHHEVERMKNQTTEHAFSAEIKSKDYIKQMSFNSKGQYPVLFECFLGDLESLSLVEDLVLEIKGENGILRIDLTKDDLMALFRRKTSKTAFNV
jgi:hypothetical protein